MTGFWVGDEVVGSFDGADEGLGVGDFDGAKEGSMEGDSDGSKVGCVEGEEDGKEDDFIEGLALGISVGLEVTGAFVGGRVDESVGVWLGAELRGRVGEEDVMISNELRMVSSSSGSSNGFIPSGVLAISFVLAAVSVPSFLVARPMDMPMIKSKPAVPQMIHPT